MKCFEHLFKVYICSSQQNTVNLSEFVQYPKQAMKEANTHIIHTPTFKLDKNRSFVRSLLIDYSSAFYTAIIDYWCAFLTPWQLNKSG